MIGPQDIPATGRFAAILTDPLGATFALFAPVQRASGRQTALA
jgi:hypothetical protein